MPFGRFLAVGFSKALVCVPQEIMPFALKGWLSLNCTCRSTQAACFPAACLRVCVCLPATCLRVCVFSFAALS